MSKKLKIGIVGCGAIGTSLAKTIISDFADKAELVSLYDIEIEKAYRLSNELHNSKLVDLSLENLVDRVDLVIEATRQEAVFQITKKAVSALCNIMIMSVGGIIEHYKELKILAEEKNVRIYIPSGAICGIDGVKAAACGKIKKITLTTRKPPQALKDAPYVLKRKLRLDNLRKDLVLFEGDAFQAIKSFPQNINVSATLSIAGIGPKKTLVRIIASPKINQNIHEIEIESDAGRIIARSENVIHPHNPKTSYLAVLSAVATLKQILEPVKIGT